MRLTAAPFTVAPQKLIIYMCGASQTPSLHGVVSLVYYNGHRGTQRAPFHQICKVNNL